MAYHEKMNAGCQAWVSDWVIEKGERVMKHQCLDFWMKDYLRFSLGLLEGNQQATEGNRNMTALLSLVSTGVRSSDELIRVATKNLESSQNNLMLEAQGQNAES